MLNTSLLNKQLETLGLNQSDLATKCEVSREAVSNWFKEESMPRPSKLSKLAEILGLQISELCSQPPPKATFAYRTKSNRALTPSARDFAETLSMRLEESACYYPQRLYSFPVLDNPNLNKGYVAEVANEIRRELKLTADAPVELVHLFELINKFGAHFIPVIWGGEKKGHENALTVLSSDHKSYFVVLNLNVNEADAKYWLAHEYGHCLSLHKLTEDIGEKFSELFAQELLFPSVKAAALEGGFLLAENKLKFIFAVAEEYGISPYHVFKQFESVFPNSIQQAGVTSDSLYKFINSKKSNQSMLLDKYSTADGLVGESFLKIADKLGSSLSGALMSAYKSDSLNAKNLSEMLGISISDSIAVISAISIREQNQC